MDAASSSDPACHSLDSTAQQGEVICKEANKENQDVDVSSHPSPSPLPPQQHKTHQSYSSPRVYFPSSLDKTVLLLLWDSSLS